MSQTDSMGSLIFSHSEELQLFNDQEVDSMMTLLGTHLQQSQQGELYNAELYKPETYQLVESEDQKPFQGQLIQYPEISELSPSLMTVPPAVISNEEYPGPFNFEVFIDPHHATKSPWVFSSTLNKLFITMVNPFPIDFKWDPQPANLYVRATPLFSLAQHVQELVTRCMPHSSANDPSNRNVGQDILDHVLRCQSGNAQYYGDIEKKIHLNVRVPLGTPQTGMETVRLMYTFVCKNSCPSGMNRKPFEVIFTLEDQGGTVYGRKKLNVRVCSCPKRDKEKEEKDFQKESGTAHGAPPAGKKRKVDRSEKKPPSPVDTSLDTKEYSWTITVCGKHNKQTVMKFAHDVMAGDQIRHGHNDQRLKCMNTINEQLKNLD